MGKVIKKKIQGMSLWSKIGLVTTLTLLVSVFMYQGWYKPVSSQAAAVTYYMRGIAAVNVGTNGSTNIISEAAATYDYIAGSTNQFRAITNNTAPAGTSRNRIRSSAGAITTTGTEVVRVYTPAYATARNIAANATAHVTVYMRTTGTSGAVYAELYEYNDTTGIVGTIKGTTSVQAVSQANSNAQEFNLTFNNTSFTVASGNRLVAFYKINSVASDVSLLYGATYNATTPAGTTYFTVDETAVGSPPTITTVSPNTLAQGATNTSVTITGTNLTGGTVTFSNPGVTGGTPTVANATTITLPVTVTPGAATGAGTVTVTTGSGSANSAFTVTAAPAPTVTSTSPNNMTQGTGPTTVTITGTNFLAGATVAFSGTLVTTGTVTVVNATTITVPVTVGATAATGLRNVTVTLPGGQTGTGTGVFTVNAASTPPTITTVSPNTLAQGATNTSVTITGTNLTGGAVTFSNPGVTGGTPTVANATTITLPVTVTPGAATGAGTVTVTTGSGSVNSAFTVTAAPAPTVTSTSPNNMTQGTGPTTVTITGTNFLAGATVAFSGTLVTTGTVTVVNATTITVPVTVGATAATGLRNVTVTLSGGQTGTGTGVFTVNLAAGCVRSAPTVTMGTNGTILPGGSKVYTVTVTNNDTAACSNSTFALARGTETGTPLASFTTPSALTPTTTGSMLPGAVYSGTTLTHVATAGATAGQTITTPVNATDATNHAAQTGSASITSTVTAVTNSLMHNSTNLGTAKGTWGTSYTCETCHSRSTTNVKRVATQINTPKGLRPVVFTRMTANRALNSATGVMGNDLRSFVPSASNLVCSACHHNTTHHQYTSSKSTGKTHYNNQNCTATCHLHKSAFAKPAGASHASIYPGATHRVGLTPGAYGTCTGCHATTAGGVYPDPVAGDPPNCTGCHINAANFNSASAGCADCHGTNADGRPNGTTFPNNTRSHTVTGHVLACAICHNGGGTGTLAHGGSNRTAKTQADVVVSFTTQGAAATFNAGTLVCSSTYCHGNGAPTWGSTFPGTGCDTCHTTTLPAATFMVTARTTNTNLSIIHVSHVNKTHNITQNGYACSICHSVPATAATLGHFDSDTPAEVLAGLGYSGVYPTGTCATSYCHGNSLKGNLTPNTPDATVVMNPTFGTTLMTGVASNDCGRCHGFPPKASYHIKTPTPLTYYALTDCKGCHDHVNAAGTGFDNIALHLNGIVEGGSCLGCHNSVKGTTTKRAAVVSQMNSGNLAGGSHHVQIGGSGLTDAHCYQCHWEADSAGKTTVQHGGDTTPGAAVNLVIYGNGVRPTAFTRGTTFISYTASLTGSGTLSVSRANINKINQHCLGCHNTTSLNKTATGTAPIGTLNVTAGSFFNDGKAPNAFAWDSTRTSIDDRYSQIGTVAWSQYAGATPVTQTNQTMVNIYGGNKKNTITKALAAHSNALVNQRGYTHNVAEVKTTVAGVDEGWSAGVSTNKIACFDCHNSHGSSVTGSVTSYTPSTTTGGIFKDISSSTGGYAVSYKPYSGGSVATKNKHNAGAGLCFDCHNTANAGTLAKRVGTRIFNTPWGYTGTFGSTQPIYGFFDYPDFGTGTNGSQIRYPVKNLGTSAGNKGGHLGASSTLGTALVAGRTNGNAIGGLCTQCHDPHGVTTDTTKVTAGKYGVPLLKGNWMTSPYREDAPPTSATAARGGGDSAGVVNDTSFPRYRIDQNTFGVTSTGIAGGGGSLAAPAGSGAGGAYVKWNFAMPTTITETAPQFGGLCLSSTSGVGATGCHVEANIKNTAAATTANWKSMTRVHNSVKGWATTGGGNAANAVHAYTCSKCHAPHTSNLPRLLVTNCLDWKHRTLAATGGVVSATSSGQANRNQGTGTSGWGSGRFPGGGARYQAGAAGNTRSSNAGPWFFGTRRTAAGGTATSGATFSNRPCHDSATAGGAYPTGYPTSQLWNTKSPW